MLTKYKINDKENFKITNKPNCKRKKERTNLINQNSESLIFFYNFCK